MSDGITEMARDQQRARAAMKMWKALGAFAEAPSPEKRQAAIEAAKEIDSIRGGYRSGRTRHADKALGRLDGIGRGDRGEWGVLILQIAEFDPDYAAALQAKSPLKDCLIGSLEQRGSGIKIDGPAARSILQQLPSPTGFPRPFLVIFPKSASEVKVI
jgi:hypothetical protein